MKQATLLICCAALVATAAATAVGQLSHHGKIKASDGPLRNAPHTADMIASEEWNKPYTRMDAVYPLPSLMENKYWPFVGRIDNIYGDKNVHCTCPAIEEYEE